MQGVVPARALARRVAARSRPTENYLLVKCWRKVAVRGDREIKSSPLNEFNQIFLNQARCGHIRSATSFAGPQGRATHNTKLEQRKGPSSNGFLRFRLRATSFCARASVGDRMCFINFGVTPTSPSSILEDLMFRYHLARCANKRCCRFMLAGSFTRKMASEYINFTGQKPIHYHCGIYLASLTHCC
jgi:hypothetical protein